MKTRNWGFAFLLTLATSKALADGSTGHANSGATEIRNGIERMTPIEAPENELGMKPAVPSKLFEAMEDLPLSKIPPGVVITVEKTVLIPESARRLYIVNGAVTDASPITPHGIGYSGEVNPNYCVLDLKQPLPNVRAIESQDGNGHKNRQLVLGKVQDQLMEVVNDKAIQTINCFNSRRKILKSELEQEFDHSIPLTPAKMSTIRDIFKDAFSIKLPAPKEVRYVDEGVLVPPVSPRLAELNKQISEDYNRYYSMSHRTFYNSVNYRISKIEAQFTPQEVQAITGYRKSHGLPEYRSNDSDRATSGDHRRVMKFSADFDAYRSNWEKRAEEKKKLDQYEIILVAGWGNEYFKKSYYSDFAAELVEEFKVPPSQIHRIFPKSDKSISENAEVLYKEIKDAQKNGDHKIILLGHSMGGGVILRTLFAHPDLLKGDRLEKIVTVQSPLKGTPTASFFHKVENVVQDAEIQADSVLNYINRADKRDSRRLDRRPTGASSMMADQTHTIVTEGLSQLSDDERAAIDNRLFYVRTYSKANRTKLGHWIISGLNDGTVPFNSQHIRAIGKELAVLPDIGHTDLFLTGMKSDLKPDDRKAFSRTLIEQIFSASADGE